MCHALSERKSFIFIFCVQNGSIFVNESSVPVNNNFCFAKLNMTESESEAEIEETSNATTESGLDIVEEASYVPMVCDVETSESTYLIIYLCRECC